MFFNLFNKKKYIDCPNIKHSLHFFYNEVRACCTNVSGPVFYPEYKGENIDWDYVYKERKKFFKKLKPKSSTDFIPKTCKGCCDIEHFITDNKPSDFENIINKVYFHNHMSCNAKCIYCTYEYLERRYGYEVLPFVKTLIDKKILSPNALIYMSGGEITISKEFEELLSLLLSYLNSQIEILTSGIKYCKSIEQAFIENKCRLVISLDSGCKDTYLKIKQVDCYDKVIKNIKSYITASDNAKNMITLKYIIIDNINDNKEEIEKFLSVCEDLGIKNVRLDIDYEKYKFTQNIKVPKHYFDLYEYFNTSAKNKELNILKCDQVEAILNKSK